MQDSRFGFLSEIPGILFRESVKWADSTSMGAGLGTYPLAQPQTREGLILLVRECIARGIPLFPIGAGTNLVGSDSPVDFLAVRLAGVFQEIRMEKSLIHAGAGVPLVSLARFAAEHSLGGLAPLSGIPGMVGGALRMNAGANGTEISEFIREIEFIDLKTGELDRRAFGSGWGYRTSPVPENGLITEGVFSLPASEREKEELLLRKERERRLAVTPRGRSAGSVFRNPSKECPAGMLLEKAGAKKLSSGGGRVSPQHANWIVNDSGSFSESDCAFLAAEMASMVKAFCGIALKTELRFVNMNAKEKVEKAASGLNILVLKGGVSAEREVSLVSGKAVADALRRAGHTVTEYDITKLEITDAMRKADIVYPVLHGGFGEDGSLQKLLEDAGLKFVGSGSQAMLDIMDKIVSKEFMDKNGIRNPKSIILKDPNAPMPKELGLPLIVKPPKEGSTFGVSLVSSESEWKDAMKLCFEYGEVALVEQYIKGVEAAVGILDGKALPLVEIRYPGKIYDYDAKYTHAHGETQYICPPTGISEKAQKESQDLAVKFYHAVGARDMLRVDVIISDKDDSVWVLEGNGLPGCTPSSLLPKAAAIAGIPFEEMCSRLARAAYLR